MEYEMIKASKRMSLQMLLKYILMMLQGCVQQKDGLQNMADESYVHEPLCNTYFNHQDCLNVYRNPNNGSSVGFLQCTKSSVADAVQSSQTDPCWRVSFETVHHPLFAPLQK